MSDEYIAAPRATTTPFEPIVVALAANTTKTVLQVAPPSTTDIRVLGWGVSFDAAAAGQPGIAHLISTDVAASVGTALTPDRWGSDLAGASVAIGGAALTGYNFTTEGTITGTPVLLDPELVYPQSGYGVWFPTSTFMNPPVVSRGKFVRLRVKMPAAMNCMPWIVWCEPPS